MGLGRDRTPPSSYPYEVYILTTWQVIYWLAAGLYLLAYRQPQKWVRLPLRILPHTILLWAVVIYFQSKGLYLFFALSAAICGELILELKSDENNRYFLASMIVFSLSHLFYSDIFARQMALNWVAVVLMVSLLFYGTFLMTRLRPQAKRLSSTIILYMLVLWLMISTAMLHQPHNHLIIIGVLLFAIADSIVAVTRFLTPFRSYRAVEICLFYTGQLLIVLGLLSERSLL